MPSRHAIAQRHGFDNRQIEHVSSAIFSHWQQIRLVLIFKRDHIDFYSDAIRFRCGDTAQNLVQVATPRNIAKNVSIEAVHADIDAANACFCQYRGKLDEATAVGGQGQLVEPACLNMGAKFADQHVDIAPNKRFAARQPDFANAVCDKAVCE